MNLYIQVDKDGAIIGHPITEENLNHAYPGEEINDTFLGEHSLIRFRRKVIPLGHQGVGGEGYEIDADGYATDKIILKELTQEEKVDLWIRRQRDYGLVITDWTQLPDAQLTDEKKEAFKIFRQELRDMTKTYADVQDPSEIIWPVKPE